MPALVRYVSVLLLTAAALAAPVTKPSTPYNLVTPAAIEAFRRFETAESVARRLFDAAIADAATKLVAELRQLQEQMTKAGNLDEAVRLRDAIADLTKGRPAAPAKPAAGDDANAGDLLRRVLPGTVWKHTDGWTMTLHKDMSASTTHHRSAGTWAIVDARTIRISVSMHNCSGYALTVAPDGGSLIGPTGNVGFTLVAGR